MSGNKAKPFQLVSIDYPMDFETYSDNGRDNTPDNHYDLMGLEQYDRLQRELLHITTPDAVFFHWVWSPSKFEFAKLVAGWESDFNLSYRSTAFVWIKLRQNYPVGQMQMIADATDPSILYNGLGYYTRNQCEEVWLLRNPKFNAPEKTSNSVRQTIMTPIGRHSEKPDEYFNRIETLYGNIDRKLECFARKPRDGWICWGNEINGRDIFDEIRDYRKRLESENG